MTIHLGPVYLSVSRGQSFTHDEEATEGFLITLQVGRLVLEWWVTAQR